MKGKHKVFLIGLFLIVVSLFFFFFKNKESKVRDSVAVSNSNSSYANMDSLIKYNSSELEYQVKFLYSKALESGDSLKLAYANYYKVRADTKKYKMDSISVDLDKAFYFSKSSKNSDIEARINYEYGVLHGYRGEFDRSLKYFFLAKDYFENRNEKELIRVYIMLGLTYFYLENIEKSQLNFNNARSLLRSKEDPVSKAVLDTQESLVFVHEKEFDRARVGLESALKTFEYFNDTLNVTYTSLLLSNLEVKTERSEKAIEYLDYLYEITSKSFNGSFLGHVFLRYGDVYYLKGDYDRAIAYYNKGLERTGDYHFDFKTLKNVSDLYFKIGNYNEAYHYLDRYHVIKDSIQGKGVLNRIESMENEYSLKEREHEKELNTQKYKSQMNLYLMFIILIVVGILFVYFLYTNKKKSLYIATIENKRLEEKMKKENEIQRIRMEQYELELSSKEELHVLQKQLHQFEKSANKELQSLHAKQFDMDMEAMNRKLSAINLQLLSKNELLDEIESVIRNGVDNSDQLLVDLKDSIRGFRNHEKDWERFNEVFLKLHPDFQKNLRSKYPDLTKTEVRVCMYLKMRLDNTEITSLLNITHQSLNRTRSHVRKKMSLKRADDLDELISSI